MSCTLGLSVRNYLKRLSPHFIHTPEYVGAQFSHSFAMTRELGFPHFRQEKAIFLSEAHFSQRRVIIVAPSSPQITHLLAFSLAPHTEQSLPGFFTDAVSLFLYVSFTSSNSSLFFSPSLTGFTFSMGGRGALRVGTM